MSWSMESSDFYQTIIEAVGLETNVIQVFLSWRMFFVDFLLEILLVINLPYSSTYVCDINDAFLKLEMFRQLNLMAIVFN